MATQFEIDCALMAGRVYQSSRAELNWFPVPNGWTEFFHVPNDTYPTTLSFEAVSFQQGNNIVISYAGSAQLTDWIANLTLGAGFSSSQLEQAAFYYLQVKAANPTATISFTGHSLGGGLASLMGVMFDERAVTFDQAPFASSASSTIRDNLVTWLNGRGYNASQLAVLAPELLSYGGYGTRTANVTGYFVQGEVLQSLPFSALGAQQMLTQNSTGLGLTSGPISLHSQALLSAFLLNNDFRLSTFKLPELLKMVFDEALYAHATSTSDVNFIEHLVRHQTGVGATATTAAIPADAMLARFTLDLQKVTQTGGFTLTNKDITNTLVIFAMQMYYENPKAAVVGKTLFTSVSGGIRFDRTDVSATLAGAKGWMPYFQYYLDTLTLEERLIAVQLLPAAIDWFVQAGSVSMSATADVKKTFMIGGTGADWMVGGLEADLLLGNAGNDTLKGGKNNDTLIGGAGFDTYILDAGDGYDTVLDSDGSGVIKFGLVEAKGSTGVLTTKWKQFGSNVWQDQQNGITYGLFTLTGGSQTLLIKNLSGNTVEVKGWSAGELGIVLGTGSALPASPTPPSTLTGTATSNYLAATGGQRVEGLAGADMILGSALADHLIGGDGADWIEGDGGADTLEGGLGNDYISGIESNSQAYGGDGNDLINAALAEGFQFANIGNIPGLNADIIWADARSGFGSSINLIYNSLGNLDLQHGFVPLAPYGGASALGGGWNFNMNFGGSVWAITYTHATLAPAGKSPTGSWEHFIVPVTNTEGVFLFGEAGDDALIGNAGADYLDGDAGADRLFGHIGNDVLDGGTQNDILAGGDGQDILLGGADNDELYGEQQDDILMGGTGNDFLWGDSPNAPLAAGDGADYLDGGDGGDQLAGGGGNDTLLGGAGIDFLFGQAGNDTLDGGADLDIDTLQGGAGDDIYLNVRSEDVIDDTEGNNTIQLASANGLATGNTLSMANSTTLKVALDNGQTLTLQNAPFGMNATLQFANGDVLDLETLVGTTLATPLYLTLDNSGGRAYGGAGADILNGGSGNDTLAGHRSYDTLQGGAGNDVYLFAAGDGEDIIIETGGSIDVLRFSEGILPGEVKLVRWYEWDYSGRVEDSLRLERMNTTGTPKLEHVHIKGYFESADDSKRIDRIEFANGTTWTYADIQTRLLVATEKADWLNGYAGVDVIDGLGGDDGINGKAGDDTLQGGAGEDDLQGGLGNDTLLGGAGNDKLFGYGIWLDDSSAANNDAGNDVLNGGAGNDRLFGGKGNDVYLFSRGDGFDEVNEIPNTSGSTLDVLRLGTGVLPQHVTLHRLYVATGGGDDLLVALDGSNTQILISGYFSTEDRQVERIEFDGGAGAVWTPADILARVQVGTQNAVVGTPWDDTFIVDHELDSITEAANAGTDTILASRSPLPLPANVENLTLTGFLNINAYGNALDNVLRGNIGNNYLIGNGGFDIAYGGQGDDTYRDVDQIIELAGEGIDTLVSAEGGVLPAQVENLFMHGLNVTRYYGASAVGNDLDNILTSTGQGRGTDFLDGGIGADTMVIKGPDRVVVTIDNLGDKVIGVPYEVRSSIDYVLAEPLLSDTNNYVPNSATTRLTLIGSSVINGVGNVLSNNLSSEENTAANVLTGGRGDDYYLLGIGDVAIELAGEGYDTVEISAAFGINLPPIYYDAVANIEKVILTGSQPGTVIGSAQDDYIIGNGGSNTLWGNTGNDRLVGSNANDTLIGGVGNDLYEIGWGDIIIENPNDGYDTVAFSYNPSGWNRNSLAENIEEAYSRGFQVHITGNAGNNIIRGDSGNNLLNGEAGDDLLDGGLGGDTLTGGVGNDTYIVDDLGDTVSETSTLVTEIDSVQSSLTYTLGSNLEHLTLTGTAEVNGTGNALDNILRGNSAANILSGLDGIDTLYAGDGDEAYGGAGNDTLIAENTLAWVYLGGEDGNDTLIGGAGSGSYSGGLGDDTITGGAGYNYIWGDNIDGGTTGGIDTIYGGADIDFAWGGFDNDTLYGNGGDDTLSGQQGDDKLYGGLGNDTLIGGLGNDLHVGGLGDDTYTVDNASDIVTESLNEGTDTVRTSATRTLDANVEHLTLIGTTAINGTGNTLDNTLTGNRANNTLTGGAGNDTLIGNATNLTSTVPLTSLVIYARGTPVLGGYPAMQVYVNGILVQTFNVDAASYTAYSVDPTKLGSAADKVDIVFGNDAYRPDLGQDRNLFVQKIIANGQTLNAIDNGVFLDHGSGAAAVDGINLRTGQETLASNAALRFTLNDNDTLDGGLGADQLTGGLGNDTYLIDHLGDSVSELANAGIDTVRSSITHTLGANLENLLLTGTAAINGTGNSLANLLIGNAGNNLLSGDAGNDTLLGSAGNDRLDGGAGTDILQGGQGNDTYIVDNAGDSLWEGLNEGWDTVETGLSHTLGASIENLTLTGTAAINGTGNALDNRLTGNSAANVLAGGAGNDTYVIDSLTDSVTENLNEGTSDRVELTLNADYTLGTHLENVTRYGTGNWKTTGNAANNTLSGNSGNDTLTGLEGNDLLWGGAGNDTLIGGLGNDTYYVDSVSDIVTEVTDQGTDLVYVWSSIAHTLAANVENGLRMFAGGSLTGNTLNNRLEGSWEIDTLDGGAGADTLTGNGGADTLKGGTGSDTYILGRDHGIDTVIETDATAGNSDIAQFLTGVATDQIWFQKVGNHLETSIIGTADKLVIQDWYSGPANHIEQFKTADGKTLLDSQVQNLVNAMASFTPPAAGQTTLPPAYQTSLNPVIAANWQ